VVGGTQLPVPSQCEVGVYVNPLHEAVPQLVEVEASWQLPAPSQAPVLPQAVVDEQRACGSVVPLPTLTQVPPAPQTWQVGQLATPQQTLSTQLPVPHWLLAVQLWPELFLGRQAPFVPVQ
jgi:hypothetical protein